MAQMQISRASLLGLPPELRNRIYREVFRDQDDVKVHMAGSQEAPILSTSKQLRREAQGLFYFESRFEFSHHDHDPKIPFLFSRRLSKLRDQRIVKTPPEACAPSAQAPNWSNVLKWLQYMHSSQILYGIVCDRGDLAAQEVLSACSLFATTFKDQPWSKLQGTLERLH